MFCIFHTYPIIKCGGKPFVTLDDSKASNKILLLCMLSNYASQKIQEMKIHNFDRIKLMPFDEVLLLDYLVYFYGTSIPRNSHQSLMEQNEHPYQGVVTKV